MVRRVAQVECDLIRSSVSAGVLLELAPQITVASKPSICRPKASGMKVIHITGYSDVTHIEGAGVVPDMTMLEKPINADMLRGSVRKKLATKALYAAVELSLTGLN